MNIHVLPSGPIQTNGYLLTDATRGEAVLIDAPGDILAGIQPILAKEGCKLTELWITHGHWDHTQDSAKVVRATGAKVIAHAADKTLIESPQVMSAFLGGAIKLEPLHVNRWIDQGEKVNALGLEFEVRHVPGHCPGNVLFYSPAAKAAFVGDALFQGSVGRTDLPGGSREVLAKSITTQIYTLPDETAVYAGHGDVTTVGIEKKTNPFVRG